MVTRRVRKAQESDLAALAAIYDRILTAEEQGKTHTGWVRGVYPTEQTAREALRSGELFVMEQDGTVAAGARINRTQVPEYAQASWKMQAPDDRVMVLHMLTVDPLFAGQGIGTAFVKFYEDYAKEQNCPYLRMDTNVTNAAARRLYKALGYEEAGVVSCRFNGIDSVQLVCLEKTLG